MGVAILVAAALAVGAKPSEAQAACRKDGIVSPGGPKGEQVANLPFAMGKTFSSLDAYLNHLACFAGPIDLPWWREVSPGIYEHMTTAPQARTERATRAELMRRFGFEQ